MVTVNELPRTTVSLLEVMATAPEITSKDTALVLYALPRPAAVGQTPLPVYVPAVAPVRLIGLVSVHWPVSGRTRLWAGLPNEVTVPPPGVVSRISMTL